MLNMITLGVGAIIVIMDGYGRVMDAMFDRELKQIKVNEQKWELQQRQFEARKK